MGRVWTGVQARQGEAPPLRHSLSSFPRLVNTPVTTALSLLDVFTQQVSTCKIRKLYNNGKYTASVALFSSLQPLTHLGLALPGAGAGAGAGAGLELEVLFLTAPAFPN